MNNIGLIAGSFDPITNGHLNLIQRSFGFCQKIIVVIGTGFNKNILFSLEERLELVRESCKSLDLLEDKKIEIKILDGLLIDLAKKENVTLIIRGIRSVTDFEYEMNLSNINKSLYPKIDTIFLPTLLEQSIISSSMVKEISKYGGSISNFVPSKVELAVKHKMGLNKIFGAI